MEIKLNDIPQGASSRLDADTVDGLQTSRYKNPSPNTLVPLGPNGKFPTSTMTITTPAGSNTEIQYNNSGVFGASNKLKFDGDFLRVGLPTSPDPTPFGGSTAGRVLIGAGPRGFNVASNDTALLELSSTIQESRIGFSHNSGLKVGYMGLDGDGRLSIHDLVSFDRRVLTHENNTTHTALGDNQEGTFEDSPTMLGVYGVTTYFGLQASQPVSVSLGGQPTNGTFYFSSSPLAHFWFSESTGAYNALAGVKLSAGTPVASANQVPYFDSDTILKGSSNLTFDGTILEVVTTLKIDNNSTGGGTASLGVNCPAVDPTTPYTWFKMKSSDGSDVYIPAWK